MYSRLRGSAIVHLPLLIVAFIFATLSQYLTRTLRSTRSVGSRVAVVLPFFFQTVFSLLLVYQYASDHTHPELSFSVIFLLIVERYGWLCCPGHGARA